MAARRAAGAAEGGAEAVHPSSSHAARNGPEPQAGSRFDHGQSLAKLSSKRFDKCSSNYRYHLPLSAIEATYR